MMTLSSWGKYFKTFVKCITNSQWFTEAMIPAGSVTCPSLGTPVRQSLCDTNVFLFKTSTLLSFSCLLNRKPSITSFPSASEIVWAVEGGRQRDIDKDRKAFGTQRQTFPVRSHQSHLEGERGSQARSEGSWEQYLRTQETGRIQDSLQEAPQGGGEGPLAD